MPRGKRMCGCPPRRCVCGASDLKAFEDTLLSLDEPEELEDNAKPGTTAEAPGPSQPPGASSAGLVRQLTTEAVQSQVKRMRAAPTPAHNAQPFSVKLPIMPSLWPHLVVPADFENKDSNIEALVRALHSGVKAELAWSLNVLTKLSYEAPDSKVARTPLARHPRLIDALVGIIDAWSSERQTVEFPGGGARGGDATRSGFEGPSTSARVIGVPKKGPLSFLNSSVRNDTSGEPVGLWKRGSGEVQQLAERAGSWWEDDELFNVDQDNGVNECGRAERHMFAVCASNVLRNMSFLPESWPEMVGFKELLSILVVTMNNHVREDPELVANAVETLANLAAEIRLNQLPGEDDSEGLATRAHLLDALKALLESPVKAEQVGAADALGRMVYSQENVQQLIPFGRTVYGRLIELLASDDREILEAAVGALFSYVVVDMECRIRVAQERWGIHRLVYIMQAQTVLTEVSRKAALTLENLAAAPENRAHLEPYEPALAELAMTDNWVSDVVSRILLGLSGRSIDPYL